MDIKPQGKWQAASKAKKCGQCAKAFESALSRWNCPCCGRVVCKPCCVSAVIPALGEDYALVCSKCLAKAWGVYGDVDVRAAEPPPSQTAPVGPSAPTLDPEAERERRARCAEERQQLMAARGAKKPRGPCGPTVPSPTEPSDPQPLPASSSNPSPITEMHPNPPAAEPVGPPLPPAFAEASGAPSEPAEALAGQVDPPSPPSVPSEPVPAPATDAETRRAAMLAAAEARRAPGPPKRSTPAPRSPVTPLAKAPTPMPPAAEPHPTPSSAVIPEALAEEPAPPSDPQPDPQRDTILAAVEARMAQAPRGISTAKAEEMAIQAHKRDLVGRVVVQLQRLGEPEPVGLHAMSISRLQELLKQLPNRKPLSRNLVQP